MYELISIQLSTKIYIETAEIRFDSHKEYAVFNRRCLSCGREGAMSIYLNGDNIRVNFRWDPSVWRGQVKASFPEWWNERIPPSDEEGGCAMRRWKEEGEWKKERTVILSSSSANIYPCRHKNHPGHLKNDLPSVAFLGINKDTRK